MLIKFLLKITYLGVIPQADLVQWDETEYTPSLPLTPSVGIVISKATWQYGRSYKDSYTLWPVIPPLGNYSKKTIH